MAKKKSLNKHLIGLTSDWHWPELNDPEAHAWFRDWVRKERPHHIVHLGDIFNLDELARYAKPMELASRFQYAVTEGRKLLDDWQKFLDGMGITWELVTGNHGDRLPKYLWRKAPELSSLDCLRMSSVFGVAEKVPVFAPGESITRDGVRLIHGTRYGKNVAKQNLEYGVSIAQGHTHRSTWAMRRLATDVVIRSAEIGCLCQFEVPYVTKGLTDWTHAHAFIENGKLEIRGKD